jgi:hypothetical protein
MLPASSVRAADYWTLTKPEVNLLIGVTTAAGFSLAWRRDPNGAEC